MLSSLLPEVAESKGVRPAGMDLAFLLVLALATALTVPVVGALLIFSLMIGPPAAARYLTDRPIPAMALGVLISLVTVWLSIAISYESNWPVGFFVGTFGAASYGLGRTWSAYRHRTGRKWAEPAPVGIHLGS
jgi:zinc/manganese transport system permease protein